MRSVRFVYGCVAATGGWYTSTVAGLVGGLFDRFSRTDVAEYCAEVEETPAEPIRVPHPVLLAAAGHRVSAESAPAPAPLSPHAALRRLHGEQPDLPGGHLRWSFPGDGIHGEVYALDGSEAEHCAIVGQYAAALGAPVDTRDDNPAGRVLVATAGNLHGFWVLVTTTLYTAVPELIRAETERDPSLADETQTTGAIPPEVLREVMSA
ncbi:hypothetical protein [Actinomadura rubrisoli]|uniref:Uncharacterized protein n=1 Tax=Actinomadura rubrisoli TaxID=2530368 RepID=A0A4R5CC73_9ACTN|nr:hypothetical protein [Actinomadura rubrisoli]TDD97578.1 hypothetical protein E1298_00680 [Actinomadura rubrisoli]